VCIKIFFLRDWLDKVCSWFGGARLFFKLEDNGGAPLLAGSAENAIFRSGFAADCLLVEAI
jgi:hypothetical protein